MLYSRWHVYIICQKRQIRARRRRWAISRALLMSQCIRGRQGRRSSPLTLARGASTATACMKCKCWCRPTRFRNKRISRRSRPRLTPLRFMASISNPRQIRSSLSFAVSPRLVKLATPRLCQPQRRRCGHGSRRRAAVEKREAPMTRCCIFVHLIAVQGSD